MNTFSEHNTQSSIHDSEHTLVNIQSSMHDSEHTLKFINEWNIIALKSNIHPHDSKDDVTLKAVCVTANTLNTQSSIHDEHTHSK